MDLLPCAQKIVVNAYTKLQKSHDRLSGNSTSSVEMQYTLDSLRRICCREDIAASFQCEVVARDPRKARQEFGRRGGFLEETANKVLNDDRYTVDTQNRHNGTR